ncbi:hypothetical protein [Streptomyces sp. NBC_00091]|uniref:hypothetical protein n=1 Tax=Streptomyces sp. NBC_00091 TaxID=2975648 RepID=UPI00224EC754|nr:hypothetical protein [Streptomyces sp. NBC_00091]MCX5380562.1 hypothetical protein [Streptomyces sp. NBC_00091]
MNEARRADGIVRVGWGRLGLVALVMVTAGACAHPLRDLGPLPPRFSGPPLPADAVVADLTSAMAEQGLELKRQPPVMQPIECHEVLTAEPPTATADASLKAAFARARSGHGWQAGPDMGPEMLSIRKNDWTATASLTGTRPSELPTTQVVISLLCYGAHSKPVPSTPPSAPSAQAPTGS